MELHKDLLAEKEGICGVSVPRWWGVIKHIWWRMWVFLRAASRTSQSRHTADLRSSNVMEQKHGNCAINSEFLISWEIMIQCVGRRLLRDHQCINTHTHTHTHTHSSSEHGVREKCVISWRPHGSHSKIQ